MTKRKLQEKKTKGICFICDGKWVIGHVCRRKELSVILVDEGEISEWESELGKEELTA